MEKKLTKEEIKELMNKPRISEEEFKAIDEFFKEHMKNAKTVYTSYGKSLSQGVFINKEDSQV